MESYKLFCEFEISGSCCSSSFGWASDLLWTLDHDFCFSKFFLDFETFFSCWLFVSVFALTGLKFFPRSLLQLKKCWFFNSRFLLSSYNLLLFWLWIIILRLFGFWLWCLFYWSRRFWGYLSRLYWWTGWSCWLWWRCCGISILGGNFKLRDWVFRSILSKGNSMLGSKTHHDDLVIFKHTWVQFVWLKLVIV